jgi:hypothetical protein
MARISLSVNDGLAGVRSSAPLVNESSAHAKASVAQAVGLVVDISRCERRGIGDIPYVMLCGCLVRNAAIPQYMSASDYAIKMARTRQFW